MTQRDLRFIVDQPGWYGDHSGYYGQLPRAFAALGHVVQATTPCHGIGWRAAGKAWSTVWGLPRRRQTLTIDELRFHAGWLSAPSSIGVILSIEDHLPALSYWRNAPKRLIGTLHFPRRYWTPANVALLKSLRSAVVLCQADLDFFSAFIGQDRVRFVRHGVDTSFFAPRPQVAVAAAQRPMLVCVGQFGRDYAQLQRIAPVILDKHRDAELHVVLAPHTAPSHLVPELQGHPRVHFRTGLSDVELLALYQAATLMLMPMQEVAASNAVVEALACGLPLVTTKVGGIGDYGGGTIFPAVPPGDDAALVDETLRLLEDDGQRHAIGERMRSFAIAHLQWSQVAGEHWRAYQELVA